jgi:hypothetical protein
MAPQLDLECLHKELRDFQQLISSPMKNARRDQGRSGRELDHPHLTAEVLPQFSAVLHFLTRAVVSITLSSSWAATYSPL